MADLVHIVAPSHSGSTLLTLLLAQHPDITTVGEMKANLVGEVSAYSCSCGNLIADCDFWNTVTERMAERGFDFDITRCSLHFRLPEHRIVDRLARMDHAGPCFERLREFALNRSAAWRQHHRHVCDGTAALIDTVCDLNDARVFVDSSKHPVRLRYLRGLSGYPLKAIHLIRDGRGVAHTYITQRGYAMDHAAHEWKRGHLSAERALARLEPSSWLRIHYEDLCREPDAVLARVLEFLALDPTRRPERWTDHIHHVVGNAIRLNFAGDIRVDDRWRREFDREQLDAFERRAGDLNRKYGYPAS